MSATSISITTVKYQQQCAMHQNMCFLSLINKKNGCTTYIFIMSTGTEVLKSSTDAGVGFLLLLAA